MPAPQSAVTDAYTRLTEVYPYLTITELPPGTPPPTGDGWLTAADLAAAGPALDAFLAWDDAQTLRDYGRRARPDVVASFGLHRYIWPACLLITVPWFLHRRVPRYPVTHISYDREAGRMAIHPTTHPTSFACLPDDPAAALPGARVVPDEETLRSEVRAAVAEHLEPLLAAFGPRMRRRGRALWGMVTDDIVEGLWYVAQLLGEEERGIRELEALLPGTTRPYVGTPSFREVSTPDGRPLTTRDRASCCMFYTVLPEDTCATCPRTCESARIAKLTAEAAA
ncbi:(2Fe-2S)-binding protein [Streptomyces sp. B93]|uniref:(2Fe-2S)-binding protein n=1 Tax=Streptomyces sp. B93 TaxID=2824875 RepID=UPI001B36BC63|nr:(2Fe-2S)-binding protein [Streptomyces sp. B93]MBQ1093839.1 (2Fe-2S)-binding protein [Streptomyces sp. B93]